MVSSILERTNWGFLKASRTCAMSWNGVPGGEPAPFGVRSVAAQHLRPRSFSISAVVRCGVEKHGTNLRLLQSVQTCKRNVCHVYRVFNCFAVQRVNCLHQKYGCYCHTLCCTICTYCILQLVMCCLSGYIYHPKECGSGIFPMGFSPYRPWFHLLLRPSVVFQRYSEPGRLHLAARHLMDLMMETTHWRFARCLLSILKTRMIPVWLIFCGMFGRDSTNTSSTGSSNILWSELLSNNKIQFVTSCLERLANQNPKRILPTNMANAAKDCLSWFQNCFCVFQISQKLSARRQVGGSHITSLVESICPTLGSARHRLDPNPQSSLC